MATMPSSTASAMAVADVAAIPEPNLAATNASLFEKVLGFGLLIPTAILTVLQTLGRRLIFSTPVPLKFDLGMSIARNLQALPYSAQHGVMAVAQKVDPDTVLKSNRFAPISTQLWTRILRPTFAGWWLAQGAPGKPESPAQSDFVVLFIHGGAYISGHPFGKAAQLLRVWELFVEKGQSMSIFGLQYTVAPEGRFPRPINEAEAAYRYLTDELSIDPKKIVLIGESAGGHLVLALLQRLQETGRPKSGFALLLYPWVDLTNSGVSHKTNKSNDILNTPNLNVATRKVVGPGGEKKFADLMNYAVLHPDRASLKDILPKTWITVGSWDTFYSSNISFVDQAKKDGAVVKPHVAEGWPHGWTSMADVNSTKAYLKLQRGQPLDTPMEGAQCIFDGLMSLL